MSNNDKENSKKEIAAEEISKNLEEDFSAEQLEKGRLLFESECDFMRGIETLDHLPDPLAPEIAFCGRSNVGKSSLINVLTRRKSLARTSNTPGRTQQLNFFNLGGKLVLVDLPGHGYAKQSKSKIKAWTSLVRQFFRGRVPLRRVCFLIDSRHGIKDVDREVMDLLDECAVSYRIILTKCDKAKKSALKKMIINIEKEMKKRAAAYPLVMCTSSREKTGIAELRADLAAQAEC